jgi:zinc D-Ala-D-Ala carboxypeptidase
MEESKMPAPLLDITIMSIYFANGQRMPLPKRMAHATPDMKAALQEVGAALEGLGGHLYLSDLFRSYEMQLQSHLDWKTGKKQAFSPAPGGSLHEAGRALDLDLESLGMKLKDFWPIARDHGLFPIISAPTAGASESWHFDCRGSQDLVYQYYKNGKGNNFDKPYAAMAASAILSIGVQVDKFAAKQKEAALQSALIRLGHDIGNIDGGIGDRTKAGLSDAGVPLADTQTMLTALEGQLAAKFPAEFQ